MHIRKLKPKDWEPYGTFPQGVLHVQAVQRGITDSPYLPLIRLGDVVVMHSRGRWGTALVTKIGHKNLTASYVTQGGIDSRPRFPNVTNKSVPIKECFGADETLDELRVWLDWHVPTDDDLPQAVNERLGETHDPASGSPGPTRLAAMFTLG
jgi:hypothetical protein